jgi:hypothetical protein
MDLRRVFSAGPGSSISTALVIRPQAVDSQPLYVAIEALP